MNQNGIIQDAIIDLKCKHCHEALEPFEEAECHNCQGDLLGRAHRRCPCGRAWMCVPASFMLPSN